MLVQETNCCGLRELDGLSRSGAKEILKNVFDELEEEDYGQDKIISDFPPFIIFTDIKKDKTSAGEKLSIYIKKYNLGSVKTTSYRINPNSGNRLKCFLWTLNKKGIKTYLKK